MEPAGLRVAFDKLGQAWFVERHLSALELHDLLLVDVHDLDLVAEVGETCRRGQTHITRADDRDLAQPGDYLSTDS